VGFFSYQFVIQSLLSLWMTECLIGQHGEVMGKSKVPVFLWFTGYFVKYAIHSSNLPQYDDVRNISVNNVKLECARGNLLCITELNSALVGVMDWWASASAADVQMLCRHRSCTTLHCQCILVPLCGGQVKRSAEVCKFSPVIDRACHTAQRKALCWVMTDGPLQPRAIENRVVWMLMIISSLSIFFDRVHRSDAKTHFLKNRFKFIGVVTF